MGVNDVKKDSYALGYTLEEEVDETKDELPVPIREVSRFNFRKYWEYNTQDTCGLSKLCAKTKDVDLIYKLAMMTRTRPFKAWKKTISLRNLAVKFMLENGYVCSNNHNVGGGSGRKFKGAFVLDPSLNAPYGATILGRRSRRLFEYVCDADMSSLYPSILLLCMIDPSNQIGKFWVFGPDGTDLSEDVALDYISEDVVKFCSRWFNLPGKDELIEVVLNARDETTAIGASEEPVEIVLPNAEAEKEVRSCQGRKSSARTR